MSELMSQLITPELMTAFTVFIVLLVVLYVLSIVWVIRDAYMRGTHWYVWGIVALVPLVGVIAYCLLRPPLLQIDSRRAGTRGCPEAARAHEVRRVCELRLSCRVRLRAVSELPHAPEEPLPELPSCARACMDRVSVLRHADESEPQRWVGSAPPSSPAAGLRSAGPSCPRAAQPGAFPRSAHARAS